MARSPFGDFRRHGPSFSSNGWNCETSKAKSHSSDLAGDQIRAAKHPFRVPNMSLGDQFRSKTPKGRKSQISSSPSRVGNICVRWQDLKPTSGGQRRHDRHSVNTRTECPTRQVFASLESMNPLYRYGVTPPAGRSGAVSTSWCPIATLTAWACVRTCSFSKTLIL